MVLTCELHSRYVRSCKSCQDARADSLTFRNRHGEDVPVLATADYLEGLVDTSGAEFSPLLDAADCIRALLKSASASTPDVRKLRRSLKSG